MTKESLHPGLGSGALREALDAIGLRLEGKAFPMTPHDMAEPCVTLADYQAEAQALLAALSLSSPIEPPPNDVDILDEANHQPDCDLRNAGSPRGEKRQSYKCTCKRSAVRAQASSEIREARPPRTVGCTADADCIHECPVSEPESRLDEFKTTVIALWDPELAPEQKKAYIASRGKELRDAAALAPSRQGAGSK